MLLRRAYLSRILAPFERMLGSAKDEILTLEVLPELIGPKRHSGLQRQMRRQASSGPNAEEVSVGTRAAVHGLAHESQIPRGNLRRATRSGLVLEARHPCSNPSTLPVGDRVVADSQDLGDVPAGLALRQHEKSRCSGPDSASFGRGQESLKATSLRSCDSNRYRCRHVVRPPSLYPEGSLLHTWSQGC